MLKALESSGYRLALLCKKSASDRVGLMSALGLNKFFPWIIQVEGNKEISHICQCLKLMRLDSWEVAVVGDRVEEEICIGNQLSMMTIWVKQGKFGLVEPTTEKQKPTHTVHNLQAVFGLV